MGRTTAMKKSHCYLSMIGFTQNSQQDSHHSSDRHRQSFPNYTMCTISINLSTQRRKFIPSPKSLDRGFNLWDVTIGVISPSWTVSLSVGNLSLDLECACPTYDHTKWLSMVSNLLNSFFKVELCFRDIESMEIDCIRVASLKKKGSDITTFISTQQTWLFSALIIILLVNAADTVGQFHTLKYLRAGFLVETHHVCFVRLTLQGELVSELFLTAIERFRGLLKTLRHLISFESCSVAKILVVFIGVNHLWRHYSCMTRQRRLLRVAQVSKHKMVYAKTNLRFNRLSHRSTTRCRRGGLCGM